MPIEDAVRNSLKDTLRDMQLDYLDLYYMPADRFNTLKVQPAQLLVQGFGSDMTKF